MKVENVQINNWESPGGEWWDEVRANAEQPLICASITMRLSWNEYEAFLGNLAKLAGDHFKEPQSIK